MTRGKIMHGRNLQLEDGCSERGGQGGNGGRKRIRQ